jgi:hypothetical protein
MDEVQKLLEIGLSGWVIFILTLILGTWFGYTRLQRFNTKQSRIRARGDVAGGDINKGIGLGAETTKNREKSKHFVDSDQSDIEAGGDVAGGNIAKGQE